MKHASQPCLISQMGVEVQIKSGFRVLAPQKPPALGPEHCRIESSFVRLRLVIQALVLSWSWLFQSRFWVWRSWFPVGFRAVQHGDSEGSTLSLFHVIGAKHGFYGLTCLLAYKSPWASKYRGFVRRWDLRKDVSAGISRTSCRDVWSMHRTWSVGVGCFAATSMR